MKVKRIKSLRINSCRFEVRWEKDHSGGAFSYLKKYIEIGTKHENEDHIFMVLCHELLELAAVEMHVRMERPDCNSDFIFVYDHRQHDLIASMFAGWLSQFIS